MEKWRKREDNCDAFGALLNDSIRAFDWLPQVLLIGKLDAHCSDMKSLNLMYHYMFNRSQRVKAGGSYSSSGKILYMVPHG